MTDPLDDPFEEAAPVPRWRRWGREALLWVGTAAVALVLLTVVGRLRAPTLQDAVPDFALQTLDGETVRLSELRGRRVLLNFWATWCGPCRVELPFLARWARNHPDTVVLALAVDRDPDDVRRLAPSLDLPFPILLTDRGTQAAYGVTTLPTSVLVDADGTIHAAHTGIALGPQLDLLHW